MAEIKELRCPVCGRTYAPDAVQYTCPYCGEVGTLEVLYDYGALRAQLDRDALRKQDERSMWRYRELLPLTPESIVPPLRVGETPLYDARVSPVNWEYNRFG